MASSKKILLAGGYELLDRTALATRVVGFPTQFVEAATLGNPLITNDQMKAVCAAQSPLDIPHRQLVARNFVAALRRPA